jgi:hypothetical protein
MSETDVHAAALHYRARGWSVIPIEPRGKRPLVPWQEYQSRLARADELEAWFGARRGAHGDRKSGERNVGIVTGAVSGLVVLDVDAAHGGDVSLAELELEHGPLPATIEAKSGGGGRHLYFAHPGGEVHNRAGIAPGIDLRGDGGCIVAPPSIHPSGKRYAWRPGRGPDEAQLAPLPAWLLALVQPGARVGHPLAHWRSLARAGAREGERNNTIASFAGHLLWHGVDAEVALELLLAWNRARCRPPLADDEVASVVASIAGLHERRADPARSHE